MGRIGKSERKSLVVAYGTYSLDGWEAFVVQITKRCVSMWARHSTGNKAPDHPDHLNMGQIRAKCAAEARELAEIYDAPFCGVRRLPFSQASLAVAKKHSVSDWRLCDVFAHARLAMGGIREAVTWLESPCPELGGNVPILLMRTQRGRYRVEDTLRRLQFSRFVPGQTEVFRFGFPAKKRKISLSQESVDQHASSKGRVQLTAQNLRGSKIKLRG